MNNEAEQCISCGEDTGDACENCGAPLCIGCDSCEYEDVIVCADVNACEARIIAKELAQ